MENVIAYQMINDGFECSVGYENCVFKEKCDCSECDFYKEDESFFDD